MRLVIACLVFAAAACTPEQSRNIGAQPKKTIDSASSRVTQQMQQGGQDSERLKDAESK
jgi:hypothetical protein